MSKFISIFLLAVLLLPLKTYADVCGIVPESWKLAQKIIGRLGLVLLIAVIASGGTYLYNTYFNNHNGWGKKYFMWLLIGFIVITTISILVHLAAPRSCSILVPLNQN